MDINEVMRIINGSKEFYFEGSVLTIKSYYSGKAVKLDLAKLDEDMLEQLQPDDEDDYEYDEEW